MKSSPSILLAVSFLASSVLVSADSSSISAQLTPAFPGSTATGSIRCGLRDSRSSVVVSLRGLQPLGSYTFVVGQTPEAEFSADARGRKTLTFSAPANSRSLPLDFDPRGREISIRGASGVVLSNILDGEGEKNTPASREAVSLSTASPSIAAQAAYLSVSSGLRSLTVSVSGAPRALSLYVDGIKRGEFVTVRSRQQLSFSTQPRTTSVALLDFDPRGKVLDVVDDSNQIAASGDLRARIENVNEADPSTSVGYIPSTGLDADGTARAKFKVDYKARREFQVELEDIPAATYELLADGTKVADIVVASVPEGGTEGEVEFVNYDSDDSDHLPLTFDPATAVFVVRAGVSTYFEGAVSVGGGESSGSGEFYVEEYLTPTSLAPAGGKAEAKFEEDDDGDRDFGVELEDIPAGTYSLWIDGAEVADIDVSPTGEGGTEGEVEFEDEELSFDPRGQLVEVKNSGGDILFSHLFGSGSAASPGGEEVEESYPMISTGILAASATAKMEFKRDEDGEESFEVELEDVPAGSYEILVEGVKVADVVAAVLPDGGTKGEVEFEDDPPLDFDPLGKLISVRRQSDQAICFERLLPADL